SPPFAALKPRPKMSLLARERKTCNDVNIRQFSLASERGGNSAPAVLNHPRSFRPSGHHQRRASRHSDREPPAAERHPIEQRIVRGELNGDAPARRVE